MDTNRIAAERLSDGARAIFHGDYIQEHVTLGCATTVHSAQGVTADTCYAILSDGTSRAMVYVAMTRGRHTPSCFTHFAIVVSDTADTGIEPNTGSMSRAMYVR